MWIPGENSEELVFGCHGLPTVTVFQHPTTYLPGCVSQRKRSEDGRVLVDGIEVQVRSKADCLCLFNASCNDVSL